jgi:hypothetical protein
MKYNTSRMKKVVRKVEFTRLHKTTINELLLTFIN